MTTILFTPPASLQTAYFKAFQPSFQEGLLQVPLMVNDGGAEAGWSVQTRVHSSLDAADRRTVLDQAHGALNQFGRNVSFLSGLWVGRRLEFRSDDERVILDRETPQGGADRRIHLLAEVGRTATLSISLRLTDQDSQEPPSFSFLCPEEGLRKFLGGPFQSAPVEHSLLRYLSLPWDPKRRSDRRLLGAYGPSGRFWAEHFKGPAGRWVHLHLAPKRTGVGVPAKLIDLRRRLEDSLTQR